MTNTDQNETLRKSIRVRGLVQGVGFRPNVWRLANELNLTGTVRNDGEGVLIDVWGNETNIGILRTLLQEDIPPLARVDAIEVLDLHKQSPIPENFVIIASNAGKITTTIIPDAATCDHCIADINDPTNRRYRYAFTNCTYCGPRLSITRTIPYDRTNTSMGSFEMCPDCLTEYEDPSNRRFHAQPNACPICGPKVWLCDKRGEVLSHGEHGDAISQAACLIKQGYILAIKGIGGFHLACDATNAQAVQALRQRKKRYAKPFALMACDIETIQKYAETPDAATVALMSAAAPIVLLTKTTGSTKLADEIAPDQSTLGFMLAYTPLHHLLLADAKVPLVMTSGNISNEPQVTGNEEALSKLSGIADYLIFHDRDIINRLDDSVVQLVDGEAANLRRARGFAPDTLVLPSGFKNAPNILALGADLKNTFCLIKDGKAMVSQHIGDLQDAGVHADYRKALDLYQFANGFTPQRIAVDMHPGYASSRWGETMGSKLNCTLDYIQHHHAHIAACLIENNFDIDCKPVLGIAFDGLGYGDDDTLWGGEFLIANYHSSKRVCSLDTIAIPGGDSASYEPWRNTFAHLHKALGWSWVEYNYADLELIKFLNKKPLAQTSQMIKKSLNTPEISSAGRLFDAVAGAIGIFRDNVHFEGQAAMKLQALAESYLDEKDAYPFDGGEKISWKPMWQGILNDLTVGVSRGKIAAKFHNTIAIAVCETTQQITKSHEIETVVLSGGVFQNSLLCENITTILQSNDIKVFICRQYPANDGNISIGQAIISAAKVLKNKGLIGFDL